MTICHTESVNRLGHVPHSTHYSKQPISTTAEESDLTRLQGLWAATLYNALLEAIHGNTTDGTRERAIGWVGTNQFKQVCALAGYDWEIVLHRFNKGLIKFERRKCRSRSATISNKSHVN